MVQISKLHDPAVTSGRINLSLAYIVDYGGWDSDTASRLIALKTRLDELDNQIGTARNRVLSHNDLASLLNDQPVGAFRRDADKDYFQTLNEFVACVFEAVTGSPCAEFATFTESDAEGVIRALLKTAGRIGHVP